MSSFLSFTLPDSFVERYVDRPCPFGYVDGGGNSIGELTMIRTYSRLKDDGSKERWHEVCARVVNGMYSIQKDWAKSNRLPWNDRKAQASAQEAYERLFTLKWCPPGRGLWVMGTPLVNDIRNSAPLQNCSFVSTLEMTKDDAARPFTFLMEASMLGIGVGFDTRGVEKHILIHAPSEPEIASVIPDTREGWVESVGTLINSYLVKGSVRPEFDYSQIRPEGALIKTFGGTAAGPEPLRRLHNAIGDLFKGRAGHEVNTTDIVDVANLIGVCVVAGNVRRSAELAQGSPDDKEFLALKDYETNPQRAAWGWMSNNSVAVSVGTDYTTFTDAVRSNGEPGFVWLDVTRAYGRLADAPDHKDGRIMGYNPCAEQPLESRECCTLVETFLNRHESRADFTRTLKFAYLYAKTVTLLPTHWPDTNAIMQRNRRIGCSASGQAAFADTQGLPKLRAWLDKGYAEVGRRDRQYSEWLGVRESVRTTTVKPSGTVSILAGETPGVHWPVGGEFVLRRIRFRRDDALVRALLGAGYSVEPAYEDPEGTVVVAFPVRSVRVRSEADVSMWEKANLAMLAQRYWSDNSVSVTISFDPVTEGPHLAALLGMVEGNLKTISFLPRGNQVYPQMPYEQITEDQYYQYSASLARVDFGVLYSNGVEAVGEKYCSNDSCAVPQ